MKVHLFDIEAKLEPVLIEEAQEMLKSVSEFTITKAEDDTYHCISRQPDFHVEIKTLEDQQSLARCNCAVFQRSKKCRHAIAALLLLREHLRKTHKEKRRSNRETIDQVLKKMSITDLRSFLSDYAMSHSMLRSELLANFLYLTKKPDYGSLYYDLAPVDKYGQLKVNRNTIKSIRSISLTLIKRAQVLLKEQMVNDVLEILSPLLIHLHRIRNKAPQFQTQLDAELKQAYRLFELLTIQPMAPRLQKMCMDLAFDICERESYHYPVGTRPLVSAAEEFILEDRDRKDAFALVEDKIVRGYPVIADWLMLAVRWMRLWNYKTSAPTRESIKDHLVIIIREFFYRGAYEDVLFAYDMLKHARPPIEKSKMTLEYVWKAAKVENASDVLSEACFELALHHLDTGAWDMLYQQNPGDGERVLNLVDKMNSPGQSLDSENFLFHGWLVTGDTGKMIVRLKEAKDIDLLMLWDDQLLKKHRDDVIEIFAAHIIEVKRAYGGLIARQRLNNIFSHLKSRSLTEEVTLKMKAINENGKAENLIKGFVFDLDGVLVDTAVHHFQSWKKIMMELGAEISEEDDHHTRGAGRMESLDYLLDKYGIDLSEEEKIKWAAKKNDMYIQSIQSITPADLLPGAKKFLDEAKETGLMVALGSASKNATSVLSMLDIADQFDAIIDGNGITASKPDPEIFIKACAALGLKPNEVVVFEDAPKGVQAALAAGCKAVGIGHASNLSSAHLVISGLDKFSPKQIIEQLT